jgi:OOP family OmpA-OmpF porin
MLCAVTRAACVQGLTGLVLCLALSVWLASLGARAHAQAVAEQGFRLDRYAAPPTTQDGFALPLPSTLGHLRYAAHTVTHYALAPLSLPATSETTLVKHRVTFDVAVALGLFDVIELHARLPMVLASRGEDALYELTRFEPPVGPALSDLTIGLSASAPEFSGITLGARVEAVLPTGSASALTSDRSVEPRGELMAAWHYSRITLAGTLGGIARRSSDFAHAHVGPEFSWGALLGVRLDHAVEASLEALGTRALESRDERAAADGLELFVGSRKRLTYEQAELALGVAIAAGLSELVGEPTFRTLFSVGVTRRPPAPAKPPAPPPDSDGDGVPDDSDACDDELEDMDGTADHDCCLDADDDGDGMLDTEDACPRLAAHSRNGCPTDDLDEDGVPDARDACPRDAEDIDGDRDEDGCPDRDSDGDGLTDDRDACPDVAGLAERQGCLAHARLERDKLVLSAPVTFDAEEVALRPESAVVLDDVATLLNARKQLQAVITVTLGRRPVPDGGKTSGKARVMMLLEALVARGVSRARIHADVELRAPGTTDRVDFSVRAEGPPPVE